MTLPNRSVKYYLRLLNLVPDPNTAPDNFTLDHSELTEENFDHVFSKLVIAFDKTITPQTYPQLQLANGSSPSVQSGSTSPGQLYLNQDEDAELNSYLPTARDTRLSASILNSIAAGLAPVPDSDVDLHFWGMAGKVKLNIGTALVAAAKIGGEVLSIVSGWEKERVGMDSRKAAHQRRGDERVFQVNVAARVQDCRDEAEVGRSGVSPAAAASAGRWPIQTRPSGKGACDKRISRHLTCTRDRQLRL
jgi:hypothetical protein